MKHKRTIGEVIRNPRLLLKHIRWRLDNKGFFDAWEDEKYIKLLYWIHIGKKLNLKNPVCFNEKIQWLKLNDHNPSYTELVDKYEVKKFVKEIIGEQHIIKTIGVWDRFDDIDFSSLPRSFVLKLTHNSGGVFIVKDKQAFDPESIRKRVNKQLQRNYYYSGREWPYKNIIPRIIAEEYIVDGSGEDLKDYKLFLFSGKVRYIQVDYDRFTDHHRNFYDTDWNYIPFTTLYPTDAKKIIEKPESLGEMIIFSEKIAQKIGNPAFVRIDMYSSMGKVYFGEVTFYHGSGCEPFYPPEYDRVLGDMIDLNANET